MKDDVLDWLAGKGSKKVISKETLNHRALIEMVSGLDVYAHTREAYLRAYEALGIDLVNRVPLQNARTPLPAGQTDRHPMKPYSYGALGVYDTVMRNAYPCATPEAVWDLDMECVTYEELVVPVPHSCTADDIRAREAALGEVGLYYPMLYTTLFMWGVEVLGWEIFMLAASMEPKRFIEHFLIPCSRKSRAIVAEMAQASSAPAVFVHDDLAAATGPVFRPEWYDAAIFPHYPTIWEDAKKSGKKIIFVADGDMTNFLPKLVEVGVDGIMFETPATPLAGIMEHFGQQGRFFIGGVNTAVLTFGTTDEIWSMVHHLFDVAGDCPGFCIASAGGLHDGIPLENMQAYFDACAQNNATPRDWRTRCRAPSR